jgi:hypothetical protein
MRTTTAIAPVGEASRSTFSTCKEGATPRGTPRFVMRSTARASADGPAVALWNEQGVHSIAGSLEGQAFGGERRSRQRRSRSPSRSFSPVASYCPRERLGVPLDPSVNEAPSAPPQGGVRPPESLPLKGSDPLSREPSTLLKGSDPLRVCYRRATSWLCPLARRLGQRVRERPCVSAGRPRRRSGRGRSGCRSPAGRRHGRFVRSVAPRRPGVGGGPAAWRR